MTTWIFRVGDLERHRPIPPPPRVNLAENIRINDGETIVDEESEEFSDIRSALKDADVAILDLARNSLRHAMGHIFKVSIRNLASTVATRDRDAFPSGHPPDP